MQVEKIKSNTMKALSIKQPWTSLIANGIKDIENRTWKTNFRGRIYIHASAKKITNSKFISLIELYRLGLSEEMLIKANKETFNFDKLDYSAIIGEVDIIDCVINHPSIWAENKNDLTKKPTYNWVLANPVLYKKPIINVKGKLSFWEFNSDELKNS